MRRQQDEAYVLATQELGDADLIVTLLARQHGKVRGVARSARRSRRRFGGFLEPLSRVNVVWFERDGRELHRVDSLEGLRSYAAMQAEPLHQAACAVLVEVTTAFSQEGHAEPETFRLIGAVLDALERGAAARAMLRYFEYWLLRVHGLLPDLESCSACSTPLARGRTPVVDTTGGGLLCEGCASHGATRLSRDERAFLEQARRLPPDRISAAAGGSRTGALEALLRGTLESFAERSFRAYRHFAAAEAFGGGDPP